ncbi:hypothetical protein V8G54_004025 [Vigna mungo]|uniref:EF-hand domain-containing protein n=1 Tax=Vigna mungo TaxID=3915 RepID=A0AAQ3PB25_VIGMU
MHCIIDRDKNGCYNNDELKPALRDLGAYFPGWRAFRTFGKANANNASQISGEEVGTLVALENSYPSLFHQIICVLCNHILYNTVYVCAFIYPLCCLNVSGRTTSNLYSHSQ